MGMLIDKKVGGKILVAGHQRRWQTSSRLGDSNSATEGEFRHVCSFWWECAPETSHVDYIVVLDAQLGVRPLFGHSL